jgi:hypothetical protein
LLVFALDPVDILKARVAVRDWDLATIKYQIYEKSPKKANISKLIGLIFLSLNTFFINGIKIIGTVMARPMKAVL